MNMSSPHTCQLSQNFCKISQFVLIGFSFHAIVLLHYKKIRNFFSLPSRHSKLYPPQNIFSLKSLLHCQDTVYSSPLYRTILGYFCSLENKQEEDLYQQPLSPPKKTKKTKSKYSKIKVRKLLSKIGHKLIRQSEAFITSCKGDMGKNSVSHQIKSVLHKSCKRSKHL